MAELGSAFGLSASQVTCVASNWLNDYSAWANEIYLNMTVSPNYQNIYDVMYWQWADSLITNEYMNQGISITDLPAI